MNDEINQHIVYINNGSGVLFQTSCDEFTYILTSDHVINQTSPQNLIAKIYLFEKTTNEFSKYKEINLVKNINYFPDDQMDIAIVKIEKVEDIPDLLRIDNFDNYDNKIFLVGFPLERRAESKSRLNSMRIDRDIQLSKKNNLGQIEATIPNNATFEEIKGQSGGGLFCIEDGHIGILGIQNCVPFKKEQMGRILFTPIKYFDKIVIQAEAELEQIEPHYLKNFRFLLPEIFNLTEIRNSAKAKKLMTQVLGDLAQRTALGNLTPMEIMESIENRLLLLYGQDSKNLMIRRPWIFWLEVLAIIQLAMDISIQKETFKSIFGKVRFFYSNIDKDFFNCHLEDLYKTDYGDLETNGVVIVASNIPAVSDTVLNPKEYVPDISRIKEEHEANNYLSIDKTDFIFDKYKFIDITALKEETFKENYKNFNNMTILEVIHELKRIYGQYIN